MNKVVLSIIVLLNISVCSNCYAAASSPFRFTDSSDISSSEDNKPEISMPGVTEEFDVEIPYTNWYGRKKRALRTACMTLCLTLREQGARDIAQRALLDSIKEGLRAQKDICPAHLDDILAYVITNAVRDTSVLAHGTPLECDFNIRIGTKCWRGRAAFEDDKFVFDIVKGKSV